MDVPSDTKNKSSRTKFKIAATILILILAPTVPFIGSYSFCYYTTYEDTSKPHDTNAYVDKAFSSYERHLSYFNFELREWVFGARMVPSRELESERLNELVENAQAFQRKLSGFEDVDDVKNVALMQVVLDLKQNKSHSETMSAIKRYTKALSMKRTFVLQMFLVDYIYHPKKTRVAALKEALLQIDQKVDELKKQTHAQYHEPLDTFWSDLKRNTTPGILESCLSVDASAEGIVEEYRTIVDLHVSSCVPGGKQKPEFDYNLVFASTFFGTPILAIVMAIASAICYCCLFGTDSDVDQPAH
uniref:Transmembrane protein n=1 Tax=Steinernema glaseri TaxID=37863 RepID=A0A1I8ALJ7_9BILA